MVYHYTNLHSSFIMDLQVDALHILEIPLIVTEQYPKGLGNTIKEINIEHAVKVVPKTKFSMVVPEVEDVMNTICGGQLKCAILCGIEVKSNFINLA